MMAEPIQTSFILHYHAFLPSSTDLKNKQKVKCELTGTQKDKHTRAVLWLRFPAKKNNLRLTHRVRHLRMKTPPNWRNTR